MTLTEIQNDILGKSYVDQIAYYGTTQRGRSDGVDFEFSIIEVGILLTSDDGPNSRKFIRINIVKKGDQYYYSDGLGVAAFAPTVSYRDQVITFLNGFVGTNIPAHGVMLGYTDLEVSAFYNNATVKVFFENADGDVTTKAFHIDENLNNRELV